MNETVEPGEAQLTRHSDGRVTVDHADPVIRVSQALLDNAAPGVVAEDGTLVLDTAGEYRYRYVRHESDDVLIYSRIGSAR